MPFRFPTLAAAVRAVATAAALVAMARPVTAVAQGAPPTDRLVVNADQGRDTISRHIYGQFAEHLGRDIYDGVWTKEGPGAGTTATT
jgi:alpha-N-arabinofuranosidase